MPRFANYIHLDLEVIRLVRVYITSGNISGRGIIEHRSEIVLKWVFVMVAIFMSSLVLH